MNPSQLNTRKIATILFDEFHSESWSISPIKALEMQPERPENSCYQTAANALASREFLIERNTDQCLQSQTLHGKNILVLLHPCDQKWESTTSSNSPRLSVEEIKAIHDFVRNGGGLFVASEYENEKYGNNLNDLVNEFGITVENNTTVSDRVSAINEEQTHVLASLDGTKDNEILIGISKACFYRSGASSVKAPAKLLLSASTTARPKDAGLIAISEYGKGRVVVVTDSDLFGDEFISKFDHLQLWLNLFYWIAQPGLRVTENKLISTDSETIVKSQDWIQLKSAINDLRRYHKQTRLPNNNHITETTEPDKVKILVTDILACINRLKYQFPHDVAYLDQVIEDFKNWEGEGFRQPDFSRSLNAFNPQLYRKENIEHLVIFPLYTPNSSLDLYFEALIIRVPWHDWLAELERTEFHNDKFVPGHLVDYTIGYDSECAVLFPETVSVGKGTSFQ